jgi:long-chain acyl-CoA synthetase
MSADSMPAALLENARARPDAVALRHKRRGIWHELTWARLCDEVTALAGGLAARGVGAGSAVALLGENRPDWIVADLALQALGARVVVPPPGLPAGPMRSLLDAHGVRLALCGDQEHVDAVLDAGDDAPAVVAFDMTGMRHYDRRLVQPLVAAAAAPLDPERAGAATVVEVGSWTDDAAPAVVHTSAELVAAAHAAAERLALDPRDRNLCLLPLASFPNRVLDVYAMLVAGAQVQLPESPASAPEDLRECSPTVLSVVPRALELLHRSSQARALRASRPKRAAYRWGMRRLERRRRGLAFALVGWPVARDLGIEAVRRIACVDGPAPTDVARFFASLGAAILDDPPAARPEARAERALRESPVVRQAVVVAPGMRALLEIEPETVLAACASRDVAVGSYRSLVEQPVVLELLDRAVARANDELPEGARVTAFAILPRPLTVADGDLTPTLSVRRDAVIDRFGEILVPRQEETVCS